MDASVSDTAAPWQSFNRGVEACASAGNWLRRGSLAQFAAVGVGTITFDFGTITDAATPNFQCGHRQIILDRE